MSSTSDNTSSPDSLSNASTSSFLHIPSGYEITECTDTNSTRSGIVGPGRIFGTFLSSAGRRVERLIDNFAEQRLALGPNMAALRLTAALHDIHVGLSAAEQEVPCRSEHMKDSKDTQILAYQLLWVCNGICSQCNKAYLPYVLSNSAVHKSGMVNKALVQLISYIRAPSPLSNIGLAAMYIHILIESGILSSDYIRDLEIPALITQSIDQIEKTHWFHEYPPDALFILGHALTSVEESTMQGHVRTLRFDVDMAHSSDSRTLLLIINECLTLGRSANHWITRSVSVMEACTLLRTGRKDQLEQLNELAQNLLDSAKQLLVLSQLMPSNILLEHITFAFRKIQNKLVDENAIIFGGHASSVYSVKFSPDGARLASCSSDNTIRIWSSHNASQDPLTVLRGHSDRIYSIAYLPEGAHIVSGSEDNTVRVWDVQTERHTIALMSHTQPVRSVAVSPDGTYIASGADDKTINIWSTRTGQHTVLVRGHSDGIRSVTFSPDGHRMVSGGLDKHLRLWDIRASSDKPFAALEGHTMSIHSVVFSPSGLQILSGSRDETVCVWDVRALRKIATLRGHRDSVKAVTFSPDGNHIMSGSADTTLQVMDARTYRRIAILEGHSDFVSSVTVSRDGAQLASCSWDSTVRMWEIGRLVLNVGDTEI